jgi:hypothetical protein
MLFNIFQKVILGGIKSAKNALIFNIKASGTYLNQ